jgi:hypothetical protein
MKNGLTSTLTPALSPRRGRIIRRLSRTTAAGFAGRSSENLEARNFCPLSPGERDRVRASVGTNQLGWLARFTLLAFAVCCSSIARAETVSIVIPTDAAPRVKFGAQKLAEALKTVELDAVVMGGKPAAGRRIWLDGAHYPEYGREGFMWGQVYKGGGMQVIDSGKTAPKPLPNRLYGTNWTGQDFYVSAADDSGLLYGCLDLAGRVRELGKLPESKAYTDYPGMTLRGVCVGMQKTYILPGRKIYEYPYTPELFPWFYDKRMWTEYLDSLVANRMNTLYLWNGHPFSSLVKLKDYPEAIEVPDNVFAQNVEMFHWLTAECDRRGIWLVQMFYNIFLPKPLAEKHGISTQLATPTPLSSDYTRKSIAEFVKQYPNVGLMVCLGEALQGTENQIEWATKTILPGVLDGMKAAGLKEQPPVVIRTHAMDPEAIMPACFQVYSNLFTETKYNGESLTTYEPRGKVQQTHLNMAKLGPHIVNVHILSNLEPFRYGATEFIRKSVLASRDRYGAAGIHLYPLAYWNWPYSADKAEPSLLQWDRDWMWFEAWARYSWNPEVPAAEDRAFWVGKLAEFYGCDANAAGKILDAYNAAGEVAPMLIRRFGITEGNRQTLALGMTLDQLVAPQRYNVIKDLWESLSPPGERLDVYVQKEWNKEAHVGETPVSAIGDCLKHSSNALALAASVTPYVTKNRAEFERSVSDFKAIQLMTMNYAAKTKAAEMVLRYGYSKDPDDMVTAEKHLADSVQAFKQLTAQTEPTYRFANSLQIGHRKIPFGGAVNGVGTNYHWDHVLPLYEKELADFTAQVAVLKDPRLAGSAPAAPSKAWPAVKFKLVSTNAETYEVKLGARPFADRKYTITELAPELNGLTGIRFSHEEAKNGRYVPVEFEVAEPVRMLIGYFQNERDLWLQVPNLDFASHADERGGIETVIRNAVAIDECPNVNVHAFRYEPGRYKLEMIGKGSFVILGVVPQSVELKRRDAKTGMP